VVKKEDGDVGGDQYDGYKAHWAGKGGMAKEKDTQNQTRVLNAALKGRT